VGLELGVGAQFSGKAHKDQLPSLPHPFLPAAGMCITGFQPKLSHTPVNAISSISLLLRMTVFNSEIYWFLTAVLNLPVHLWGQIAQRLSLKTLAAWEAE
jgi:hypothetical protein